MNLKEFQDLQTMHGSSVVWLGEDGKHYFTIGDVDDSEFHDDMMDRWIANDIPEGVEWAVGYGDDQVNCVVVDCLEDLDKIPGLEDFIIECVGENCYTEGNEYEDGENDDEE